MKLTIIPILLWIFSLIHFTYSENILFLLPISSKSHKNVFEPLIKALALKGHNITTISSVKSSGLPSSSNVHEIVPVPTEEIFENYASPFEARKMTKIGRMMSNVNQMVEVCHKVYGNTEVQHLLQTGQFDLIIVNAIGNHCFYGMIPTFNAPTISLLTLPVSNFISEKIGTHLPPSFVPLSFLDFTERMTFKERLINTCVQWFIRVIEKVYYRPMFRAIKNKYHGESWPEIGDIESNFSMLLVNSHYSMNTLLPLLPDIVEIGGMHCRPAQAIEQKHLSDWLSGAEEGFIYFSLGSIIQGNTMPEEYRKIFINVFSKLNVKVLWKWETEVMEDLPPNVKLSKWLPQQDILDHPNVKLFITHGGLLSTQEAVYHGVPLIGFPFFADQDLNMVKAERLGLAIKLEILELTEDKLEKAIKDILGEPQYQKRASELSTIFRDQPETSLERAVFWSEYVMRHKGAPHLRSPARNLYLFQYHSYDVILFILLILSLLLWLGKTMFLMGLKKVLLKIRKNKID